MGRSHRSVMTLPAGVCVFACGLSSIIADGGFVGGWNLGGGSLVIRNTLVNIILLVNGLNILVNGICGGRFVNIVGPPIIPYGSNFAEPVTLPFTTVHSSLNVPSPVTGACSLVVPYPVILLVIRIVIEWNLIVLRPSK
jgi:hypothetical protein